MSSLQLRLDHTKDDLEKAERERDEALAAVATLREGLRKVVTMTVPMGYDSGYPGLREFAQALLAAPNPGQGDKG